MSLDLINHKLTTSTTDEGGVITGAIILFEDYYSGVILYSGVNKIGTKGKRHSSKVPITDTSVWRILEEGEQVVLSNNASHKKPNSD